MGYSVDFQFGAADAHKMPTVHWMGRRNGAALAGGEISLNVLRESSRNGCRLTLNHAQQPDWCIMDAQSETKPIKRKREVSSRGQIERLFGIAAMIQNDRRATVGRIAAHFEVDRRTILRDIAFLRERLGVGIEFDHEAGTYVLDSNFTHIPPLELNDTDFLLLSYLHQCIAPQAGTDIGKIMIRSFKRMFGLLTGSRKWKEFARTVLFRFDVSSGCTADKEVRIFNLLHRAINANKEVTFAYKSPKKPAAMKLVEPCLLTMYRGRWYLYGVDTSKNKIVLFAFARIEDVKTTGRTFTPEVATHSPRNLLRYSFGVSISADPPVDVVLEFEKEVVQRLKESVWHQFQELSDLPDGRARLVFRLSTMLEIRPWILSWGPYVKVIAPAELAADIAESGMRIAARYSSEP
jgi:proteasome accessory factor B